MGVCPTGAIKYLPKEEAKQKYIRSMSEPVPSLSTRLYKYYEKEHMESYPA